MKNRINLFNSLNNAEKNKLPFLLVNYSKFSLSLLQILQESGFISHWHLQTQPKTKENAKGKNGTELSLSEVTDLSKLKIKVYLRKTTTFSNLYSKPFFKITPLSKSSRPIYSSYLNLWKIDRGLSLYILSSPIGLITDRQARQYKIGGELICKIQSL
jgi:small subunit ribosomal protein S8